MSRRKRARLSHGSSLSHHHHYPPLLLSPIVTQDKHNNQSPFHIQQHNSSPHTASPSPTQHSLSTRSDSAAPSSLVSTGASSWSSASSLLCGDPFLLDDDELPDVDAVVARERAARMRAALASADVLRATSTAPWAAAVTPPVQRALSYQPVSPSPSPPPAGVRCESSPADAVAVRTISIPAPVEGLEEYPSLGDILHLEEDERADAERGWREMEADADFVPLSELLDDDDDDDGDEWRRRKQAAEQQRWADDSNAVQSSTEVAGDGSEDGRDEADEFAATQVLSDPNAAWSQAQSPVPTQQLHGSARLALTVEAADVLPSPVDADEDEDSVGALPVPSRPRALYSRRIYLSACSPLSPTATATPVQ